MAAIPQMASFLAPKWPTFYFHWKYLFFKNGQPTRQNINWLDRQELWNINDTVHVSTGTGTRPIEQLKRWTVDGNILKNNLLFVFAFAR